MELIHGVLARFWTPTVHVMSFSLAIQQKETKKGKAKCGTTKA
jgi:hypothetical protein